MSRIRITGGQWRSRLIQVADAPGLRPTPDRVRETLFNWLGQKLDGLACLDLFAGTGALGFEAASRGAARVVLVEQHARSADGLRAVAGRLDALAVEVVQADAGRWVDRGAAGPRFDLVFLDPPFGQGWLARILPKLPTLLAPGARVYIESESAWEPAADAAPLALTVLRRARAGQVHYHLLEWTGS